MGTQNMLPYAVTVKVGAHTTTIEGYIENENQWQDLFDSQISSKVKTSFTAALKAVLNSRKKVQRP